MSCRQVRLSSIEFVRQVLDVYQKDFLIIITKELLSYQNKLNIDNIVNREISLSQRMISNNSSMRHSQKNKKDAGILKSIEINDFVLMIFNWFSMLTFFISSDSQSS